jgi:hypothetical protein
METALRPLAPLAPACRAAPRRSARRAPAAAALVLPRSAGDFAPSAAPLRAGAARRSRLRAQRAATAPVVRADAGESPVFKAWESKHANTFRRSDIKRIMVLGAGPIIIGQVRARCGGRGRSGGGVRGTGPGTFLAVLNRPVHPHRPASSTTAARRRARRCGASRRRGGGGDTRQRGAPAGMLHPALPRVPEHGSC